MRELRNTKIIAVDHGYIQTLSRRFHAVFAI